MSTPILPVEGLRAAEGSSDEMGSANQATRTRQREPINTREGGAPLLVHRLHSSSDVCTPSGATARGSLEVSLGAELLHILQQTRLQLLGRLLSARRTHFLTNH